MKSEDVEQDKETVVRIVEELEEKLSVSGKRYELDIDAYQTSGSAHHHDRIWEAVVHELNDAGYTAIREGRMLRITAAG